MSTRETIPIPVHDRSQQITTLMAHRVHILLNIPVDEYEESIPPFAPHPVPREQREYFRYPLVVETDLSPAELGYAANFMMTGSGGGPMGVPMVGLPSDLWDPNIRTEDVDPYAVYVHPDKLVDPGTAPDQMKNLLLRGERSANLLELLNWSIQYPDMFAAGRKYFVFDTPYHEIPRSLIERVFSIYDTREREKYPLVELVRGREDEEIRTAQFKLSVIPPNSRLYSNNHYLLTVADVENGSSLKPRHGLHVVHN